MRLTSISENSIRIVLLLLAIQFFSLTAFPDASNYLSKNRHSITQEHGHLLTLSMFSSVVAEEEDKDESESERVKMPTTFTASLATDISGKEIQAAFIQYRGVIQKFGEQVQLFKFHHAYLI